MKETTSAYYWVVAVIFINSNRAESTVHNTDAKQHPTNRPISTGDGVKAAEATIYFLHH